MQPVGEEADNGPTVRRLKRYVNWVQTVVRQVGLTVFAQATCTERILRTKGVGFTDQWCDGCSPDEQAV